MKVFSKAVAVLAASVLCLAFLGCKNSTNEDDGNSISKLETPTNLVINSITDNTISVAVNITFNYDGKFEGATYGILGYSVTNDSSQAIYDSYNSTVTLESGTNTRTANIQNWTPVSGKKYYFWLKATSSANNVSDSAWSNVAEFTYSE